MIHLLRTARVVLVALACASCGSSNRITGPATDPAQIDLSLMPPPLRILGLGPLPGAPSTVLSGVVYESTAAGNRPLPNTEVRVQSLSGQVTSTVTNSEGRYEIAVVYPINGLPRHVGLAALQAVRPGYRMPCRPQIAHIVWADGQPHQANIYLVADRTLVTAGIPAAMPRPSSALSGTVFEQSSEGTRPLIGARVYANPTFTETLSDAQGRYLLCGFAEPYGGWYPEIPLDPDDDFGYPVGDILLTADRWSHRNSDTRVNVFSTTAHDILLTPR